MAADEGGKEGQPKKRQVRAKLINMDLQFSLQDYEGKDAKLYDEEEKKLQYKDQLAKSLGKIVKFDICQVLAVGPLLIHAIDRLRENYSSRFSSTNRQDGGSSRARKKSEDEAGGMRG